MKGITWIRQLNAKTTAFGLPGKARYWRKSFRRWEIQVCKTRHGFCWCVLRWYEDAELHPRQGYSKCKHFTLKLCYTDSLKTAGPFYRPVSNFPFHTAKFAKDFLATNCSEIACKDKCPPNSPVLNPIGYLVWGAMLERCKTFNLKHRRRLWWGSPDRPSL